MKVCVTCVYWILLLISVISSGLLFLIVASENAQTKRSLDPEQNETFGIYENISLEVTEENFEPPGLVIVEAQRSSDLKTKYEEYYRQEGPATVAASFESTAEEETEKGKDLNVDVEGLTQQPNLSQGISETGQAVVLTLVDTAAAELQSLAEPKPGAAAAAAADHRKRPSGQNSSAAENNGGSGAGAGGGGGGGGGAGSRGAGESEDVAQVPPSTQIPSPPIGDEVTERPNDTDSVNGGEVLFLEKSIVEEPPEVVVVVRAEQKVADSPEFRLQDEVVVERATEEVPKLEDAFTTAPELNDTAARAQLVAGARDEAAAVVLDGIVTSGPSDPHEDIPSFSEWAQKRLEEAEKKKSHPNVSVQNPGGPGRGVGGMKVRSKNYASPDCGAKVVAANPEARSARSVLVSTRDEYMLNTCTSRIWFVVELCEAIQAKKIELANFELFSSSPKDFSVYVSDRLSSREWSPVGQFTAKDVKDIQSFALHPHLFGKFIKVELHTYYGSEHFCPISLFRAYGTSEFEVLETETENQVLRETSSPVDDDEEDSDEEEELEIETGEPPRNLFGSARDAVLSIVKKAAEVLVKSSDLAGNNITEIQQNIDGGTILQDSYATCTTPRYTILCGNCSDQKFAKVFQLVSCRERQLDELLRIDLVNGTLRETEVCGQHGVEFESFSKKNSGNLTEGGLEEARRKLRGRTRADPVRNLQATFLASVFKPEYIVALCNVLATKERKVVMNTSYEIPRNSSEATTKEEILTTKTVDQNAGSTGSVHQVSATCSPDSSSASCKPAVPRDSRRRNQDSSGEETEETTTASIESSSSLESLASQIKPTKTLSKEDAKEEPSIPVLETSKEPTEETAQVEAVTSVPLSTNVATPTLKLAEEPSILGTWVETAPQTVTIAPVTTESQELPSDVIAPEIEFPEPTLLVKTEKSEQLDQEGSSKQGKAEFGEQEVKLSSQDSLTLDTLFSDLKDLESDAANLQNGPASSASSVTHPTTSTTPQKESVFLRLSNRIKALERNMSLSGQYLEELSRRYKKQVEEMQRSLERAVSAMGEESRKGEERDLRRLEEIATLREEIGVLSKSVEGLLYDRDSWRGRISTIGQHVLLICLEVTIVILIFSYCRRTAEPEERREEKQRTTMKKDAVRRKSTENFGPQAKKTKKRRPSEIVSHITGTYEELMIEDKPQEPRADRKKKRKKEANHRVIVHSETKRDTIRYKSVLNVIPGGPTLPSRRASSIDPPKSSELQTRIEKRPESAPEPSIGGWFEDGLEKKGGSGCGAPHSSEEKDLELDSEKSFDLARRTENLSESSSSSVNGKDKPEGSSSTDRSLGSSKQGSSKGSGILKSTRLSSPSFMKTALGSRKKRKLSSNAEKWEWNRDSGNSNDRSPQASPTTLKVLPEAIGNANGSAANGLLDDSDESRSSSATPTSGKKEKKNSLKKMVRKLF